MTFVLRHKVSGLFVKDDAHFGHTADPKEADRFPSAQHAIAKSPLPVQNFQVVQLTR